MTWNRLWLAGVSWLKFECCFQRKKIFMAPGGVVRLHSLVETVFGFDQQPRTEPVAHAQTQPPVFLGQVRAIKVLRRLAVSQNGISSGRNDLAESRRAVKL